MAAASLPTTSKCPVFQNGHNRPNCPLPLAKHLSSSYHFSFKSPINSICSFPPGHARIASPLHVGCKRRKTFWVARSGGEQQHLKSLGHKVGQLLTKANTFLPHVVLASTLLALVFPPSFKWFTNRYYAPALGFLMFAVGINLDSSDFIQAFRRPLVIVVGYMGQFVLKPLLGVIFASIAVSFLHLPQAIGSGIILVSCVSGAQLSNYATYLVEPTMAPLSIVMTALSTATAVVITPALTLLLLGRRLPIDVGGMILNITQIVVAPIAAGILLNRFAASISRHIRPALPLLSVVVTSLCVGSPLAMNVEAVKSPFGLAVLVLVFGFHAAGFLLGFHLAGSIFLNSPDRVKIQKTISFETGMQSSLLGLALANRFFADPLVGLPPAISQ